MDEMHFAGLARTLSRAVGRRPALITMVAGLLVGATDALGPGTRVGAAHRQRSAGAVPDDCESDADCPPNGLCLLNETCFFPSGCAAGTSALDCCREAVRASCRNSGGGQQGHGEGGRPCRRKGFRRCQQNFGTG